MRQRHSNLSPKFAPETDKRQRRSPVDTRLLSLVHQTKSIVRPKQQNHERRLLSRRGPNTRPAPDLARGCATMARLAGDHYLAHGAAARPIGCFEHQGGSSVVSPLVYEKVARPGSCSASEEWGRGATCDWRAPQAARLMINNLLPGASSCVCARLEANQSACESKRLI